MKKNTAIVAMMIVLFSGSAFCVENIALDKHASQSSEDPDYRDYGWSADKVVDGNADGNIRNGSVCYTDKENQPWWQVDLGAMYSFDKISIWNRTDASTEYLNDFYVFISNSNIGLSHTEVDTALDDPEIVAIHVAEAGTLLEVEGDFTGRYVRIQLASDTTRLMLAEVEVWTDSEPICTACSDTQLQAKYSEGIEAGKQFCLDDPQSCGIDVTSCVNDEIATVSSNLDISIPSLNYQTLFGIQNIWADLEFSYEENGDFFWKLNTYGVNEQ